MTAVPRWRTNSGPWPTCSWPYAAASCRTTSWWYDESSVVSPLTQRLSYTSLCWIRTEWVSAVIWISSSCVSRLQETCCVQTRTLTLLKWSDSSGQRSDLLQFFKNLLQFTHKHHHSNKFWSILKNVTFDNDKIRKKYFLLEIIILSPIRSSLNWPFSLQLSVCWDSLRKCPSVLSEAPHYPVGGWSLLR